MWKEVQGSVKLDNTGPSSGFCQTGQHRPNYRVVHVYTNHDIRLEAPRKPITFVISNQMKVVAQIIYN